MFRYIKSFVSNNERELAVLLISVAIGVSIIGVNLWSYSAHTSIYSTSTEEVKQRILSVERNRPMSLVVPVTDSAARDSLTLKLHFREVDRSTSFDVYFNGEEVEEDASGFRKGSTHNIEIDTDLLKDRNHLEIRGNFNVARKLSASFRKIELAGFSSTRRAIFLLLNFIGILTAIGPFLWMKYLDYSLRKELERHFPGWMRDVVEGVRSGMSLPQAIENTEGEEYGRLSKEIERISAKLDWGMSFEKVMSDFAERSESQTIERAVSTIVQAYESGGDISEILDSVGDNLKEIRRLRKERSSRLYGEVITGYVVYFLFLGILVMLVNFLLPSLGFQGDIGPLQGGMSAEQLIQRYRPLFRNLVVIQSIFSGLVIGKLSQGELKAGAKHSAILLGVGYTVAALLI